MLKRTVAVIGVMIFLAWGSLAPVANEAVRIVVPFPAGGTTDILARQVAVSLSEKLGVSVYVENIAGASGSIGSAQVARAVPNGKTLLLTATHHVINPTLMAKLPYDTQTAFSPIALVATVPNVLVINPNVLPAKNVRELIDLAKKDPGKIVFGSAGAGGANHLSGELFKMMAGIDLVHVPYKGSSPAMIDLLGGHIPMMFDSVPAVLPWIEKGQLRALAVTSLKRSAALPDVPTMDEAGVKGFEATSWFGLYMPYEKGSAARTELETAMKEILASNETHKKFAAIGLEPGTLIGEPFRDFVNAEIKKWGDVIRTANIGKQ
jgi:tripartite-type tricarboxylate transporter receptor subunit TctC